MYRRYCKEDIEDIEMNTKVETAEKGSEVINGSLQEAGELVGRCIAEVWEPTAEGRKRSD